MEEVSQVFAQHGVGHGVASGRLGASGASGARVVVYVDVHPHQMVSWRLTRDAELRAGDAAIWLTRHRDPYDYWMKPGDVARRARVAHVGQRRGHRSVADVVSRGAARRGVIAQWLARVWPRTANAL